MGVFRQFPYSNFHEMNMDEIIKIVKNMLEEWAQYYAEWDAWMNQMNYDWSNYQEVMNEAWQNMQDFINNYFDNLDVQEEINNKITSMVASGEFATIVDPFIPPRVTAWLAEHITEPVGVVIDTSLSVEGACADAKATGDAIDKIKDAVIDSNIYDYNFINGFVRDVDGDVVAPDPNGSYYYMEADITGYRILHIHTHNYSVAGTAFYDEDDNFISGIRNSNTSDNYLFDNIVTVPENATTVRISTIRNYVNDFSIWTSPKELYVDTNNKIDGLSDALTYYPQYPYVMENGFYSTVNKTFNASNAWSSCYIPVEEGDIFRVTATAGTGYTPLAMFFNNITPSASSYVGKYGVTGETVTYVDEEILIPAGVSYMALSNSLLDTSYMIVKKKEFGVEIPPIDFPNIGKMAVQIQGSRIAIKPKKHSNTEDLIITMGHTGGNNLFDFISVGTTPNTTDLVDMTFSDITKAFVNGTDWLVSMQIRATDNIDGDNPTSQYFTGGNHRSNNTEIGGVVTAYENDLKFYIDDVETSNTSGKYCDKVRIEWSNSIMAYNTTKEDGTGRTVITQYYTLEIDNSGIFNITIKLVPTEDVIMSKYYGFGWSVNNGDLYWYPGSNTNRFNYIKGTDNVNSGDLYAVSVNVAHGDVNMEIGVDNKLDWGRLTHLGTMMSNYINYQTKNYSVAVFEDTPMTDGASYYFKGHYKFN